MQQARNGLWVILVATILVAVTVTFYAPYLAERINYASVSGQIRANKENLVALRKGDTLSPLFHTVAEIVIPAVVVVEVTERVALDSPSGGNSGRRSFLDPFDGSPQTGINPPQRYLYKQGLGSGIIIDANNGYILTNWHVVHGADTVAVTLSDGRTYTTQWIRTDRRSDLAVIKIDAADLVSLPLGDSDAIQVGDWVLAVGAPEGLTHTLTAGIISARRRDGYQTYLQTDAAINPGNSGGPLANMHAQVIGINTAIISSVQGNEGIGLAIPSNTAQDIASELIEKGKVTRGYLGVEVTDANQMTVESMHLPSQAGSLIVKVTPDSPAQKAGLQPGDFITAVNDKKIGNSVGMLNTIADLQPGQTVVITFYRDGRQQTCQAVLGEESG